MEKVKRDTTRDLFFATLEMVKENGHYDKAAAIMDYVLPSKSEHYISEDIELSNYRFDFYAAVNFGGSEGIYIDCWLSGEYTEEERKVYNHGKGVIEVETRRSVGIFKTLRDDLESMKIMGELCGALVFYASQYINKNIDRYTPTKQLEKEWRAKNAELAQKQYIQQFSEDLSAKSRACDMCAGPCPCETCAKTLTKDYSPSTCESQLNGCRNGIAKILKKEIAKHSYYTRYTVNNCDKHCNLLDIKFNAEKDRFDEYVEILMTNYPGISICQAAGHVYTWLCTRKQDFIFDLGADHEEG